MTGKISLMKRLKFIFPIILTGLIFSCYPTKDKLLSTDNNGGYKLSYLDKTALIEAEEDEIIVFGKVMDLRSNEPLTNSELIIGCNKFITTSDGKYHFKIKKSKYLYLKASSIGYKNIETRFLDFNQKNSIKIVFFLEEDDRPLINCEGNI